jgi:lactoylglutathione lyase
VLSAPRWTHVALPVADVDASLDWYGRFTPLRVLTRMEDDHGRSAWIAHEGASEHPFVLVLVEFASSRGRKQPLLQPFAHLGIELTSREDVDRVAARARQEGCLAWDAQPLPPPVGYVCAANDPDGNVVEFSYDQGVYAKATEVWGEP